MSQTRTEKETEMRFTHMLFAVGALVSMSAVTGQSYAQTLPPEVKAVSSLLNPGKYFELRPGAGVRYDETSREAVPQWWVGGKVVASPRKWLGIEGTIQFDVPGHHKPRAEASTFVRF